MAGFLLLPPLHTIAPAMARRREGRVAGWPPAGQKRPRHSITPRSKEPRRAPAGPYTFSSAVRHWPHPQLPSRPRQTAALLSSPLKPSTCARRAAAPACPALLPRPGLSGHGPDAGTAANGPPAPPPSCSSPPISSAANGSPAPPPSCSSPSTLGSGPPDSVSGGGFRDPGPRYLHPGFCLSHSPAMARRSDATP